MKTLFNYKQYLNYTINILIFNNYESGHELGTLQFTNTRRQPLSRATTSNGARHDDRKKTLFAKNDRI